ncbi:MAG: hypothetical protein M1821_001586 [Bathelium mastoideum]|nr:MAG: hypothetical protein M1821_001586 [Bathelium mastoideum]
MATLPFNPTQPAETPTATVIGVATTLAVVLFLVLLTCQHSYTRRHRPRACLVYEERSPSRSPSPGPSSIPMPERLAHRQQHGSSCGSDGKRGKARGGGGGGVNVKCHSRWWRPWQHPHAYCQACEARAAAAAGAGMEDLEVDERKRVKRPQPAWKGQRGRRECGGEEEDWVGTDWPSQGRSATEEEEWRGWKGSRYGTKSGTARVPRGMRAGTGRGQWRRGQQKGGSGHRNEV